MKTQKYDDYQKESRKTWGSGVKGVDPMIYDTLGMLNEGGEFAGKVKKIFRDKEGNISDEDRKALKHELGDVLWYFTQICTQLGYTLEEVAEANLEKIFSRKDRNVLHGDGDNR